MKNFAITGVAGYIAPRHLQAIKDTGNHLVAACDSHDSVGILDRYFQDVSFFTEFERFDRHLEKLRRNSPKGAIDYLTICSPNNLHDAHIRLALRLGADAICEKPLVLNPWNLDQLQEIENRAGSKLKRLSVRHTPRSERCSAICLCTRFVRRPTVRTGWNAGRRRLPHS
jgi:UDP-N-acetyl-2-amino-2-deoxyglucuronate dehydrogenase